MAKSNPSPRISITPLGGVGEIGSNCTVFENDEHLVIVDYGILFPYEDFFDINYLIASLDSIKDTPKKVSIFITHGHEDHIGAIIHLNQVFPNAEIHAPKFAQLLMRKKLHNAGQSAKISTYQEDSVLDFGDFEIHPVSVTHSIPDTYGLVARGKRGEFSVLFISDFKYDLNPLYEAPFNTAKIKDLFSKSKKRICMMDSTNILNEGKTPSERDLVDDFGHILQQDKRIFITLFSSNIYRLKTILNHAKQLGKRVVPIGRSIRHYIETANECGFFGDEISTLKDEREVQNPNSHRNIYLLTGCQGDHFGALRRVATGEHKFLKPSESDVFVFSSKPIPGNESKIYRIYNTLAEHGCQIITNKDMSIHASGHPGQQDLRELYKELKPDLVVPIHGESYFLRKHLDFLNSLSINGLYLHNFHRMLIDAENNVLTETIQEEAPSIIHGKAIVIEREAISKRRKMACNGVCFISIDSKTKKIQLTTSGLPESIDKDIAKITNLVKGQLGKRLMAKDSETISEEVRIFARNLFQNYLGYKPITYVHIL